MEKYITGRIDLKNFGSEYNSIQIVKNTDSTSKVEYPRWFKSDNGEGIIVQSKKMHLDLIIKCVNDGLLKIWLRGQMLEIEMVSDFLFILIIGKLKLTANLLLMTVPYYGMIIN